MRIETLPLEAAAGHMRCHNLADGEGRKAFTRGRLIRPEDRPRLVEPGHQALHVVAQAERAGRAAAGVLKVRSLRLRRVGVILVSTPATRLRVERGVLPAIEGRVADLGGAICECLPVAPHEEAVSEALAALQQSGAELLMIAGATSVMGLDEVPPRGIRLAGGRVEHDGAPVEPGNLLLLAYLERQGHAGEALPILGAPGCVRSRAATIVDLLLPRLMAGEQLRRHDIVALGHGGLLR